MAVRWNGPCSGSAGGTARRGRTTHAVRAPLDVRERVLAMKALWTEEEASYQGEFVAFDRAVSHPKPVQRPHPPILFGAPPPRAARAWSSTATAGSPSTSCSATCPPPSPICAAAPPRAREPDRLSVSVFAFEPPDAAALARLRDLGVERTVIVAPRRLADALPFLDRYAN